MITITICNESESDRKNIFQALSKVIKGGEVYFEIESDYDTEMFESKEHMPICLCSGDILYFEYINRKIRIVTKEKEYICINEKISNIAKRMKPHGFSMCHQSFVVNLHEIDKIGSRELVMRNGDHVYLAQKRAAGIRKELRSQSGKILI